MNIEQHRELIEYLKQRGLLADAEQVRCVSLPGGVSCRTVLVQRDRSVVSSDTDIVIKQALPKLKVQHDWFSDPARIHNEAAAMRQLNVITPVGSVPKFMFEDRELQLLSMEAVPEPHDNWKTLLLAGQVHLEHFQQFARLLAEIHRTSYLNAEMQQEFHDRRFFETLRLEPYYAFTAKRVPAAAAFLQQLITETHGISVSLVHGDYSPKNILIHQGRLVLLDHEVMHFGDGAFDLGFSLTHFLSKARHVAGCREKFHAAARVYWDAYRSHFNVDPQWDQRVVRHTIACMLARVRGKSPLEYFNAAEQTAQAQLCLNLLKHPPTTTDIMLAEIENENTANADHE